MEDGLDFGRVYCLCVDQVSSKLFFLPADIFNVLYEHTSSYAPRAIVVEAGDSS